MMRSIAVLLACFAAAGCASTKTSFALVDARQESRFGDGRTTVAGADILLADDDFLPRLIDRLGARLDQDLGAKLKGREVRVTAAEARLLVEDGRVVQPPRGLSQGRRVEVIRTSRATAHKRFTVTLAGEVDGKSFRSQVTESWVIGSGDLETSRAVNRALTSASAELASKL